MPISSIPRAKGSVNIALLSKVCLLFSFEMIAAAAGSYFGRGITGGWELLGLFLGSMVMLIVVKVLESESKVLATFGATFFAFLIGLWCGPSLAHYSHTLGWSTVALSFLGTVLVMILFGGIGAFSGRDFSSWGPFLFQSLIGLIVARIIFLFLPAMSFTAILSGLAGALLFSGYFVYDFYKAAHDENTWENAIDHSINIFLDFINMLFSLLSLESGRK
jgi:FtsH-binding integral membrane protein